MKLTNMQFLFKKIHLLVWGSLLVSSTFACREGTRTSQSPATQKTLTGAHSTFNVLVMDTGFDVTHEVFKDRILESYTLKCKKGTDPAEEDDDKPLPAISEVKGAYIESLQKQDQSCSFEKGLVLNKSPRFTEMTSLRDEWNKNIKSKSITKALFPNLEGILEILDGEKGKYQYHGTATAGLIAYLNPKVRFVLVQTPLLNPEDADKQIGAQKCPKQDAIDFGVKLHLEPDVEQAYLAHPPSVEETQLQEILVTNKINVINISAGRLLRQQLEEGLKKQDANCVVNFSENYRVLGELDKKRNKKMRDDGFFKNADPLIVQAAGNEGMKIETRADTWECSTPENNQLIIGSLDANGGVSEFSNRGKCVDIFTLGDGVIVAAPDHWLNIASGTSFSTPLIARYLSLNHGPKATAPEMTDFISQKRNVERHLASSEQPQELAYAERERSVTKYALTGQKSNRTFYDPRSLNAWKRLSRSLHEH